MAVCNWNEIMPETAMFMAACAQRGDTMVMTIKGRPVDYARNNAVRLFLKNKVFTHLFFIDSDISSTIDTIDKLLALEAPLASGCCNVVGGKGLVWACLNKDKSGVYHLLNDLPDNQKPFYCDGSGAGCLLIRRDVFDKIAWPWFQWIERENGTQMSEDVYFCQKANNAGLRVRFDPKVHCDHFKIVNLKTLQRK